MKRLGLMNTVGGRYISMHYYYIILLLLLLLVMKLFVLRYTCDASGVCVDCPKALHGPGCMTTSQADPPPRFPTGDHGTEN